MKQDKTVGDYIKVENPFSTSEAYELIELLKDHNTSQDFKLINTGTIDPYVSLWGIKTTSYLKESIYIQLLIGVRLKQNSLKEKGKHLLPKS